MTRRLALAILGAAVLVVGGLIALGGVASTLLLSSHHTLTSPVEPVAADGAALVTDPGTLSGVGGVRTPFGGVTLRISATPDRSGRPVFLGVGPSAAVDRYLAGHAVDTVTALQRRPFRLLSVHRSGTGAAPAPAGQAFWVARAQGGAVTTLVWRVAGGAYRVVAMNADGRPGLALHARLSLQFPRLYLAGVAVLAVGLVLLAVGAVLLVLARRTGRRPAAGLPSPVRA